MLFVLQMISYLCFVVTVDCIVSGIFPLVYEELIRTWVQISMNHCSNTAGKIAAAHDFKLLSLASVTYCNTVGWAWLDWGFIWWLTILLQCFDIVGWVTWPVKISSPNDLYCVEWDVKPYSTQLLDLMVSWWNCESVLGITDVENVSMLFFLENTFWILNAFFILSTFFLFSANKSICYWRLFLMKFKHQNSLNCWFMLNIYFSICTIGSFCID